MNTLGVQAVLPVKPPTLQQGMKAHGKNWHGTDVQTGGAVNGSSAEWTPKRASMQSAVFTVTRAAGSK